MNSKEIEAVAALYAGLQSAIVQLADVIVQTSAATHEQIATLFDQRAQAVPPETQHAQMIRTVLLQVGAGIRGSSPGGETWEQVLNRLRS